MAHRGTTAAYSSTRSHHRCHVPGLSQCSKDDRTSRQPRCRVHARAVAESPKESSSGESRHVPSRAAPVSCHAMLLRQGHRRSGRTQAAPPQPRCHTHAREHTSEQACGCAQPGAIAEQPVEYTPQQLGAEPSAWLHSDARAQHAHRDAHTRNGTRTARRWLRRSGSLFDRKGEQHASQQKELSIYRYPGIQLQ